MQAHAAYEALLRHSREQALLVSCTELLSWDELTYMPRGGVEHRGNQMAYLAGLMHDQAADPRFGELLDVLQQSELVQDPLSDAAVNVRELRRIHHRATRVPRGLVEEMARISSFAQQEWNDARKQTSFAIFQPWLERIVALKRREADSLATCPDRYDTLLDDYEPGARSDDLARLFAALRNDLVLLLAAITGARRKPNVLILRRDFPVERQRIFGETVAAAVGFDFERGRLDTTPHPFFGSIGPGDVRITTRFHADNFSDGFFGILHEVGHALYEQGLDPARQGTPVGDSVSLGMHESQARLWENTVGRSRAFWKHFLPMARRVFPEALAGVRLDDFHFAINRVQTGDNRVQADEITYNLHILVRFELERALLSGDLPVADVPAAWNDAYRQHLGVTPPNDAEGCLQDGHWSAGMIAYFPTYTLGNVFAAQLFAKATQDLGDLSVPFARGEFAGLLDWLRANVHRQGQRYHSAKLVEHITGSPPDHRPLVEALRRKYSEIYGI
ncbi:MAG: carboxypeptidase M32 [Gemmataceae bacterium]|nr:carboxypeptidase M32 [Gemmataceae bacterium]